MLTAPDMAPAGDGVARLGGTVSRHRYGRPARAPQEHYRVDGHLHRAAVAEFPGASFPPPPLASEGHFGHFALLLARARSGRRRRGQSPRGPPPALPRCLRLPARLVSGESNIK
eukprot:4501496-Pyramimonas_sp.AAC.1